MTISINGSTGITFPSGLTQTDSAGFPSGTVMLFVQTAAPTGWTKSTSHDNKALRVVSGTAGTGGSVAFTTAFASQTPSGSVSVSGTVGGTTLTTGQIPSHTHGFSWFFDPPITGLTSAAYPGGEQGRAGMNATNTAANRYASSAVNASGGGGSHDHSFSGSGSFTGSAINLAVQYVDTIIATKN